VDRLTALLDDVLSRSGYVHKVTEGSTELKLRRLVRRLNLNSHDVKVWLGMVRQILWKLKS